ncbi:argininosuccinate synthase domain-containing protein [Jiangella asiatica]|uniref:argininosuccinate synthase n=1 Tax=Jiangella asiatica TaxID=2530372 RepID=A0A4R5CIB8_9ACTN|nr:argininosuccinate synthase domain-containing protein [Jiangella asiatica]TDD98846.1 hypothetical protein E1269_28675 [Jiangella asiatica]
MSDLVVLALGEGGLGGPGSGGSIGARVVAVAVQVGPGSGDADAVRDRALAAGAVAADVVDARDEFADHHCLPALKANALHPRLLPALSTPLVAEHLVAAARRHGARTVAHGFTGDARVGFEAGVAALAPDLTCLAVDAVPSRPAAALWGPPRDGDADELVVTFDAGRPVAIDGETVTMWQAIELTTQRARAQGVGDTAMPGASVLAAAHRDLEAGTVERDLARFKAGVDRRWSGLVHAGRWFSPLRRALDDFVETANRPVSGEVRLTLRAGAVSLDHQPLAA